MNEDLFKKGYQHFTQDSPIKLVNRRSTTSAEDIALTKFEEDISQVNL